jgi:mannitol/fructose-specific phosphotransferase system IIA component (Ntr-type)
MLQKQSSKSISTNSQHFIDTGEAVLQQAGESLNKAGEAIANGLNTALKFGLGAITQPKAFKAYTQELISNTAVQINGQVEQGKVTLGERISKATEAVADAHEYAMEHGKEGLKNATEMAKAQLKEGLDYLKMEAVDFPVAFARRAIANQAIDIQSGLEVRKVKLGTTKLIDDLQLNRGDKGHLLALYRNELREIHESASNAVQALNSQNNTGHISRQEYINERTVAQERFAESISKLQSDVAEVTEAVAIEVRRNRLKFNQKGRTAGYTAEGKGSHYEPGSYAKTIDKHWKAARGVETHDLPQWVRTVAGY